jgi:hypothetical protein
MEEIIYSLDAINATLSAGKSYPWQELYHHYESDKGKFVAFISDGPKAAYDFVAGFVLLTFFEPVTSTYDNRHAERHLQFFESKNEALREATRRYEAWLEGKE